MGRGELFRSESHTFKDATTGVEVRQLTQYRGHSHHLYFTNPGWWDDGRRLLFGSERCNRINLYSVELESGEITQLTDVEQHLRPEQETRFQNASKNPVRDEAYFWNGPELTAVDLRSLRTRVLHHASEGFRTNGTNVTADGRYVCCLEYEDLSGRFPIDLNRGYVGFYETWEAHPLSRIVRVDVDSGQADVVLEDKVWIGHVNTSPTLPAILTYCHEGPWMNVDNRMWGFDLETGKSWALRRKENPTDQIGHEWWQSDGIHIGYHGRLDGGRRPVFGSVRWDDTERVEIECSRHSRHYHSNDMELVVGDGTFTEPLLLMWRRTPEGYEGPRVVLHHRSSFHIQATHVHPRFSPDGGYIVYTSDTDGYGNVYTVKTPRFESQPTIEEYSPGTRRVN